MAKYKNDGALTYDLGYLMNQLGVRTTAQRKEWLEPKPAQPDAMPPFEAEPVTYAHTPTDPEKIKHDAALRKLSEGLR